MSSDIITMIFGLELSADCAAADAATARIAVRAAMQKNFIIFFHFATDN